MSNENFREHLLDPQDRRLSEIRRLTPREYAVYARSDPFTGPMIEGWAKLYDEPFVGICSDGTQRPDVFDLGPVAIEDRAPVEDATGAAARLLRHLSDSDRQRVSYPLGAHEWRSWANPEFMQHDTGLRLEDLDQDGVDRVMAVLAASLSDQGLATVRRLLDINAFMGELVDLPRILNRGSYNVAVFGTPSPTEPWGWQLFGHHVALNCLFADGRMVVSPVFLGAEPNVADVEGGVDGRHVFSGRIDAARAVIGSLTTAQLKAAITSDDLQDPDLPEVRLHSGDERTLVGCFQDNRVVPPEGVCVADLDDVQRALVLDLVDQFLDYLPEGPRRVRRAEVARHLDEAWFSWMGRTGSRDPFYVRVQSPVVIVELDHHCGIFLGNRVPAEWHIHTVVRTPNGNDYGRLHAARALGTGMALPGDLPRG